MTSIVKIKADSIKAKIAHGYKELSDLQNVCSHPNVKVEHRGDTGNYDRSADCYWSEHSCPDCGKFWREEK